MHVMPLSTKPVWMRGHRSIYFYVACASAVVAFLILFANALPRRLASPDRPASWKHLWGQGPAWHFEPIRDSRNLGLTDEQCDIAFPKLYTEINRAHDHFGPGSIKQDQVQIYRERKPWPHAQIHVLIHSGQLYIIDYMQGASNVARGYAGLSSLYRALTAVADPSTIPNVEFILDIEDTPALDAPADRVVWGWNRPMENLNTWVAPDFDGWAFPNPDLGSYISFRDRLRHIEEPFARKIPKAAWRGNINNAVRESLMDVVRNASDDADDSWADVATMKGHRLHMAEFCKYMFAIHTEGIAWSGRLRYLQNCESVAVVHQPLRYQAHYYDLLVEDGPEQNYIAVRNDFSDLEEKIKHYLARPALAERIAKTSAATFRDRYLTPAAEACYWRRMLRAWADCQAFKPDQYDDVRQPDGSTWKRQRGVDWEAFLVRDPGFKLEFPGGKGMEGEGGKKEKGKGKGWWSGKGGRGVGEDEEGER